MIGRLQAMLGFMLLVAAPICAQPASPTIEVALESDEVVPGQYTALRVTVLVPTWLTAPVEFPGFEMPNLRVRMPQKSTRPISQRVGGDTWSGVTRRYLLSPMVPGNFTLPPGALTVAYATPGASDPVQAVLQMPPITLLGIVPPGAEDLDPFVAAETLTLTQEITEPTRDLKPGDAVKRTVTATITGASPIVLPPLLGPTEILGLRAYPDAPKVSEIDQQDSLSGTRVETVTYMAESGGAGAVPGIVLRWYNLGTKTIETATLEGFDISVDAPVQAPLRDTGPIWRQAALALAVGVLALLLVWWIWPRAARYLAQRRAVRLASKPYARRALLQAVDRRDYPAVVAALTEWKSRAPRSRDADTREIDAALMRIAAGRYGAQSRSVPQEDWATLAQTLRHSRRQARETIANPLPPLNPSRG